MTTRKAKTKAKAKASASSWLVDGLRPTLRDETAKDGAPVLLWLEKERQGRKQIPHSASLKGRLFGDDSKKGNDKGKSEVALRLILVSSIPPIANSAMDGAPERLWLSMG
jgi:hypothetical protein